MSGIKINTICCEEEMILRENYLNGEDYQSWTCLKCGCFKNLIVGTMDEEDLEILREQEK